MNETEKDALIKDLCHCLRNYRVTAGESCRLIAKRQAWRVENKHPADELLSEVYDTNHDALVLERASYNRYRPKDKEGVLRRLWFGITQQYEQ